MRILYHHRTLGQGAEGVHIREVVRAFRALGHDVFINALIGDQVDNVDSQRRWLSVRRFIPEPLYELAEVAYNPVGRQSMARAIAKFRPDFIYDRYNSYSLSAVVSAANAGLPAILEVNSPVVYERTAYENLPLRLPKLALRYERRIFTAASHLFAVSTPLKEFIVSTYAIDAEKISSLPNGVNPAHFSPEVDAEPLRAALGLSKAVVIGFSGSARPWHGLPLVVEALSKILPTYADVYLLILGGGPSEMMLRKLVDARGIGGKVKFVERVDHKDVPKYIAAMDITVSPRATFYASPLKIVEYMSMAKAIVAPAMRNIEDLLVHEKNALLFEAENVDSLAKALIRLITNTDLRLTLGQHARRVVESSFNWQANAQKVIDMASRLCANSKNNPVMSLAGVAKCDRAKSPQLSEQLPAAAFRRDPPSGAQNAIAAVPQ